MSEASNSSKGSDKLPFGKDPLSYLRAAWEKGEPLSDYEELRLCELVSKPENISLLSEIGKIAPAKALEIQQTRILVAGDPAVDAVYKEALRDAHEYARETSKSKRKDAKARLKNAQKTIFAIRGLSPEFPVIKTAEEAIGVSLEQPYLSNGKISLACSLIEQGKGTAVLDSITPEPGVVTGVFARDRMGQLLTSNKMTPKAAEWAVNYLGDCIRRADGEKRAKAISTLLQEASGVPLARQKAIEEAASIAYRTLHADQRKISKNLHAFSVKAPIGSPEKTLFMDFAQEIRKHESVDPKLFPVTLEERQNAGGKFRKDTTLIMEGFYAAAANAGAEEARSEGKDPSLRTVLRELDEAPVKKMEETNPLVKLDKTVLLTPQTLANKFARGEGIELEGLDPKIFSGQPPHRILNATNVLLAVEIPQVEKEGALTRNAELELTRNHLVTSLLFELEDDVILSVLEKRHGGQLPEGVAPKEMFVSVLMGMHNDSEGLKKITRELLSLGISEDAEARVAQVATVPEPAQPAALPKPVEPAPVLPMAPAPAQETGEFPEEPTVKEIIAKMAETSELKAREPHPPDKRLLKAMQAIAGSKKAKHRASAYNSIVRRFTSGKGAEYTQLEMIREISAYLSLPAESKGPLSAGCTIAEGLLSMPQVAKWGPVESQLIRSILASANPEYVNPAILNKLKGGNESEKGEALLVLAERAEINGRAVSEGASLYEIALTELIRMGQEEAVPALFSLADSNCPELLLQEFITAYEPAVSGAMAVEIILSRRAETDSFLFFDHEPAQKISDAEAMAALQTLNFYGGGPLLIQAQYDESLTTMGAAAVPTKKAVDFLVQGLHDSEDAKATAPWKAALLRISDSSPVLAEHAQYRLASHFNSLSVEAREAAFELLVGRPSAAQASFLVHLVSTENKEFSGRAIAALENYCFSGLKSAESFAIMKEMYLNSSTSEAGAKHLKGFLPLHREDAAEWMGAQALSEIFAESQDPELAAAAREALVATAEGVLSSKHGISGLESILHSLSSAEPLEVSELATYALASEMRRQGDKFSPVLHKALFKASRKLKDEDDDYAIGGIILAAQAARTTEAMRQVLVPYLAAEEPLSGFSANALLSSREGARQLALAAAMENHPEGISGEGSLRISQNAFNALSQADTELSSEALISLLREKKDDLQVSAYAALEKAGDSKCPALIRLLSSGDSWERYAAINLLPQREEFASKALPLSIDADASVSASAMEYVLSASGAKGLAKILSNPEVSEEIQQALSGYCTRNKPEVSRELLLLAQSQVDGSEDAIRALEFFPTDLSFPALLSILESGQPTAGEARKTLVQMCWLLSAGTDGEEAENAAHDLFEVYLHTADPEVRTAIVDSARGPFARFLVEDAIKGPGHAQPALGIFIETENIPYAAEVSQYLMGRISPSAEEAEGLPPLWRLLFAQEPEAISEIKPGSVEYRVLQEVAEQNFAHGQGSRESRELLFSFMKNFGSRQVRDSLFERGPLAVSEFLWSMRGDANEDKAVIWLRSMRDEGTSLLLDVLVSRNYSALDKLTEDAELAEVVFSHAMRRALMSFAELSRESGTEGRIKAMEGLELYSQLLSKDASIGMPFERAEQAGALQKNLGLKGMITEEGIAKGQEMLCALCQNILEISSLRASARAEARKLSRAGGNDGLIRPVRPEKAKRVPK